MSNIIYPDKLILNKPRSLKLGIKSSLPEVQKSISLLYFLWKSNNMPFSLDYTKEIDDIDRQYLDLSDDVKGKLLNYTEKYQIELSLDKDKLLDEIVKNPLLTSQIEAIIVAFELVWKFAKIEFVDGEKSFSSERKKIDNRTVRFNKRIEFTNLIDIFDLLIRENLYTYELDLFRWLVDDNSKEKNGNLVKFLTMLSDESIYKISLDNDDIQFTMGGLYGKLSNGNEKISIRGKEPKGSLRILGNILDNDINFFLKKDNNEIYLSSRVDKEYLGNYSKRTLLRVDLENVDLTELDSTYSDIIPNIFIDIEKNLISLSKPFLILAGISGTGKSRFVRKQAEQSGGAFKLIPVCPDWHEPSELLGYKSYLGEKPTYHITEFVRFLIQAWQEIFPYITETAKGIKLDPKNLEQIPPFWLCLDEMNLAPVEQYFADYLAVIETREWLWGENSVEYHCDPLIPATVFDEFGEQFGLDDKLLSFFQKFGLPLPFNLMVAGTVNMDETTHGFSRKVLDRALSFDFSEFYPNDFEQYFEPSDLPIALGYPVYSSVRKQDLQATVDSDGEKSIAFLSKLNEIFAQSPFKLGYRALNELLLSVVCFNPTNNEELQAVWDDFLMFKLLPRLEGDEDKLACDNGNVLQALLAMLPNELSEIWDNGRKDFLRKRNDESITIPCRSKAKLTWMLEKLNRLQFTTFWQ